MQKGLGGAWNQWAALVAERERLRGYMRRVLHRGLVAALHHWMALREERARMKRVCRRLKSPGLGRAWTAWLDLVDARRRLAVSAAGAHRSPTLHAETALRTLTRSRCGERPCHPNDCDAPPPHH
eukprot:4287699-Prymnesium_polylepis.2